MPAPRPAGPSVLLASEGRPFAPEAIAEAALLARPLGAAVRVLTIARIWGTAFGFPNPWLLPSRREWDARRDEVAAAVAALERHGLHATGEVLATRNAARRIVRAADALGCAAIVMTADRPRSWLAGNLSWADEPRRVQRAARQPVHLVTAISDADR